MTTLPSLLIADDHPVVVNGLAASLGEWFRIVGTVSALDAVDARIREFSPAVVLLDISFGDRSSIRILPALVEAHPDTRFVMLTAHTEPVLVDAALQAGAAGYVAKESPISEIRGALVDALAGRTYVTPLVRARRGDQRTADRILERPEVIRPSDRQVDILLMLRDGATHREISDKLGISTKTVEYHLNSLRRRLGIASLGLLIRWAEQFKDLETSRSIRVRRQETPPGL
jgi:DNA-binding NarL/FixJ family response regulator